MKSQIQPFHVHVEFQNEITDLNIIYKYLPP